MHSIIIQFSSYTSQRAQANCNYTFHSCQYLFSRQIARISAIKLYNWSFDLTINNNKYIVKIVLFKILHNSCIFSVYIHCIQWEKYSPIFSTDCTQPFYVNCIIFIGSVFLTKIVQSVQRYTHIQFLCKW